MADAIASVAPAVTSTSPSGSYSRPQNRRWWAAMAARSSGIPGPGGYWLRPAAIASAAAASISRRTVGVREPLAQVHAPVRMARADISAKIVVPNGCMRSTSGSTAGSRRSCGHSLHRLSAPVLGAPRRHGPANCRDSCFDQVTCTKMPEQQACDCRLGWRPCAESWGTPALGGPWHRGGRTAAAGVPRLRLGRGGRGRGRDRCSPASGRASSRIWSAPWLRPPRRAPRWPGSSRARLPSVTPGGQPTAGRPIATSTCTARPTAASP